MKRTSPIPAVLVVLATGAMTSGCATMSLPSPDELRAPAPIQGNGGKYMCPYTSDGVLAEWTDKAVNAKIGATIGKHAGAYAGQKALQQVPFVGGLLGSKAGEAAGRAIAIETCGGMENIRATSDLSFNTVENMAVYMYVHHSTHEHYQGAVKACSDIYPQFGKRYHGAIRKAARR